MKEIILSKCEKSFVVEAIANNKRLDGRLFQEFRSLTINFGSESGSCQVSLGETKVFAQVTCEITQPKSNRPNEGNVIIYVEFNPMGAPHFEVGRSSEAAIQVRRLLEKLIIDSHCIDLELLCIVSDEKVWTLRLDVHILNYEGSLIDAVSIAALGALGHFKRPDGDNEGIPLTIHHFPTFVTFAVFDGGNIIIADPSYIEERCSDSQIAYGLNSYREVCCTHLGGKAIRNKKALLQCCTSAATRASQIVLEIKEALMAAESSCGIWIRDGIFSQKQLSIALSFHDLRTVLRVQPERRNTQEVRRLGEGSAEMIEGDSCSTDDDDYDEEDDVELVGEITLEKKLKDIEPIVLSDASEEEVTITLQSKPQKNRKKKMQ